MTEKTYDNMTIRDFLQILQEDLNSLDDDLFREEFAKRLDPLLAKVPEFAKLEEIVNADHRDRLVTIEDAIRLPDEDDKRPLEDYSLWDWFFYRGQMGNEQWTAMRARFTDDLQLASSAVVENLALRIGTLEAGHMHDKESTSEQFEHLHSDSFSIDQIKEEIINLYSSKFNALEKKLSIILKHIGDQPVTKTLKEEVASVKGT